MKAIACCDPGNAGPERPSEGGQRPDGVSAGTVSILPGEKKCELEKIQAVENKVLEDSSSHLSRTRDSTASHARATS